MTERTGGGGPERPLSAVVRMVLIGVSQEAGEGEQKLQQAPQTISAAQGRPDDGISCSRGYSVGRPARIAFAVLAGS